MDTPIKHRASKPRVTPKYCNIPHYVRCKKERTQTRKYYVPTVFICYNEGVRAIGKTIEGAYKNWVSLREEYLNILSSDRDYK